MNIGIWWGGRERKGEEGEGGCVRERRGEKKMGRRPCLLGLRGGGAPFGFVIFTSSFCLGGREKKREREKERERKREGVRRRKEKIIKEVRGNKNLNG